MFSRKITIFNRKIPIFDRKYIGSIRGPHFPLPAMLDSRTLTENLGVKNDDINENIEMQCPKNPMPVAWG